MNWTQGTRILFSIVLVCLVTAPSALAGISKTHSRDDSTKWAPDTTAALGISSMECKCSYTLSKDPEIRFWSFESEPRIRAVDPEGPAHRLLEAGDAIVAIDRMLITTHEAGKRFANLVIGEPVELTVRRRGSLVDVSVVPVEAPEEEPITVDGLGEPLSAELLRLRIALEGMSGSDLDLDLGEITETLDALGLPDLEFQPTGWFGIGLSFSGSMHRSSEGGGTRWRFYDPPEVASVSSDGPADRAGLRRRDVLTHIDGVRLDTKKGGRLFSQVLPGQSVEFEVRRLGLSRTIVIVAEERPELGSDK